MAAIGGTNERLKNRGPPLADMEGVCWLAGLGVAEALSPMFRVGHNYFFA